MDKKELQELVNLRMQLIGEFKKLKDYKSNKNAIMRELDHVKLIEATIVKIDAILSGHVTFS